MDKNRNKELQSRREFFKNAAKGVLPILGTIVLANAPVLAHSLNSDATSCTTCRGGCYGCAGTCSGNVVMHALVAVVYAREHVEVCVITLVNNYDWQ